MITIDQIFASSNVSHGRQRPGKACRRLEFDKDSGEDKACQALGKMKVEASRLLVRMIIALASLDGNFDKNEQRVASKIARELNLNPAEFELQ